MLDHSIDLLAIKRSAALFINTVHPVAIFWTKAFAKVGVTLVLDDLIYSNCSSTTLSAPQYIAGSSGLYWARHLTARSILSSSQTSSWSQNATSVSYTHLRAH